MSKLSFILKNFHELSTDQLYDCLRLRSEIFVVEQDCVYQDVDDKDQNALHVLGYSAGELAVYARCFVPGFYFEEAAIGRVLVKAEYRGKGFGHLLMDCAIKSVYSEFGTDNIRISAQQHLTSFYENHGFYSIGKGYLEDGIPHINMIRQ